MAIFNSYVKLPEGNSDILDNWDMSDMTWMAWITWTAWMTSDNLDHLDNFDHLDSVDILNSSDNLDTCDNLENSETSWVLLASLSGPSSTLIGKSCSLESRTPKKKASHALNPLALLLFRNNFSRT